MTSKHKAVDNGAETARQQMQLLADISDSAVAYLDTQRCFKITNKAFKQRFGDPQRDATASDFFAGICLPTVNEYLETAVERGKTLRARVDRTGPGGGTERLRLHAVPHTTAETNHGVLIVRTTRGSTRTGRAHGLSPAHGQARRDDRRPGP